MYALSDDLNKDVTKDYNSSTKSQLLGVNFNELISYNKDSAELAWIYIWKYDCILHTPIRFFFPQIKLFVIFKKTLVMLMLLNFWH